MFRSCRSGWVKCFLILIAVVVFAVAGYFNVVSYTSYTFRVTELAKKEQVQYYNSSETTTYNTTSITTPSTTQGSPTISPPPDQVNKTGDQVVAVDTVDLLQYIHSQCIKHNLSTMNSFEYRKLILNGTIIQKEQMGPVWPRIVLGSYKHKLMYSSNPKCGSTSFKKFLIRVHGDLSDYEEMNGVHHLEKHETRNNIVEKEKQRIITEHNLDPKEDKDQIVDLLLEALERDYYYVGFIRNPFTRLVSGFRDKVLWRHHHMQDVKADIGPGEHTEQELFYTFVKLMSQGKIHDFHFGPYYDKMKLCTFPYNLLGQVETTGTEIPIMLQAIGLPDLEFPGSGSKPSGDLVQSFFGKMPADILNMFYEWYRMDFELTGYTKLGDPNFPYIVLPPNDIQPGT